MSWETGMLCKCAKRIPIARSLGPFSDRCFVGSYVLSQAGLISIFATIWSHEILTERHGAIIDDIQMVKKLLRSMSVRNTQAQKFSTMMERLMPDTSLESENIMCTFDGSEYDENILNAYSEVWFAQADDWARLFWPAPS